MRNHNKPEQLMLHWVTVVDAAGRPRLDAVWTTGPAVAHEAA